MLLKWIVFPYYYFHNVIPGNVKITNVVALIMSGGTSYSLGGNFTKNWKCWDYAGEPLILITETLQYQYL